MQGYAYILTHPGQPSVFYDHLYEWGSELKQAILDLVSKLLKLVIFACLVITTYLILQGTDEFYISFVCSEHFCFSR